MAFNVAVVSGTRAEYGLLRPMLEKIKASSEMELSLIVTGSHLSRDFGYTISEIEGDGYIPDAKLDIMKNTDEADSRELTAKRTAKALSLFLEYFTAAKKRPDVVLLLGDRYEIFAAGQAAALLNIPVAHISGGDVTHGADDDWFRHCLTKMAKIHFPSCEVYRKRLIQMGERPETVFNVGGLGDENVRSMQLLYKSVLSQSLGLNLDVPYALVTFHPETQSDISPEGQGEILLEAMRANSGIFYIITKANADAGGFVLNKMLENYCKDVSNAALFESLGALRYLSAMKYADFVLGNSSSGIAETPSFGIPCVNIGNRQKGRVRSANIIDCPMVADEICRSIRKAIDKDFKKISAEVKSPYNGGDTSGKINDILLQCLKSGMLNKPKEFYDVKFCQDDAGMENSF